MVDNEPVPSRLHRNLLVTALALVLALAGCGTDSHQLSATQAGTDATATAPAPNSNENRTRAGAKAALLEQFAAYQSGDASAAYATLSEACRESFGELDEFAAIFELGMGTIEDIAGSKLSDMELVNVEVLEFTPQRAGLKSSLYLDGAPVYEEEEEGVSEWLMYEDGEWKAECPDDYEVEKQFETVGEVIGEDFETSTTVTTVPPNWPTSTTTTTTTIPRMTTR